MSEAKSDLSRQEGMLVTWAARVAPLRRFGWAFLLAWVFCVFYTEVVDGYAGNLDSWLVGYGLGEQLFFSGLPVFMSVGMLVIIVLGERRLGTPADSRLLRWLAPVATAVSTPLLFFTFGGPDLTLPLFIIGSALTGFGSGFMWVMWGEFYAKIAQDDAEFLAPVSAVVAALLVLLVSAMEGWVALAFVTSLPLLSGLCFFLSWRDVDGHTATAEHAGAAEQRAYHDAHNQARLSPLNAVGALGREGLGIVVACIFVCLAGTFWGALNRHGVAFQGALVVGVVFMAAVTFASTMGPRRISISFLYRWMCPALVLAFASVIVLGIDDGGYLAYVISLAARLAFCVITQLYFARYATAGKMTAVQAFGIGWICVHVGDLLGVIAFVGMSAGAAMGLFSFAQVAAVSLTVLVFVTMYVLNDRRSFAVNEVVGHKESEPASKRSAAHEENPDEVSEAPLVDELEQKVLHLAAQFELTPRETEVFELLARGRSIPYVRDALVISKETAATHAKHIYAKMEVHSRQELIDLVH